MGLIPEPLQLTGGSWAESMGIDPTAPSRAVVANSPQGGAVLWYVGADISFEIQEGGLSDLGDLGLDDAPEGISIWEGTYLWFSDATFECDEGGHSESRGAFRKLDREEWAAVEAGHAPWNPADWEIGPVPEESE